MNFHMAWLTVSVPLKTIMAKVRIFALAQIGEGLHAQIGAAVKSFQKGVDAGVGIGFAGVGIEDVVADRIQNVLVRLRG